MYELAIQRIFSAAHQIAIRGALEQLHGHDWRLTVVIGGQQLDDDGLLVDFHEVERIVDAVIEPFRNANLNQTPPFDRVNPTAEHVAEHIGRKLVDGLKREQSRLIAVRLTEAPGCEATWRPE